MVGCRAPHHSSSHTTLVRNISGGQRHCIWRCAPTPKPSPLMGRLWSNRRRESKAWLMIEWHGRVRRWQSCTGEVPLYITKRHMRRRGGSVGGTQRAAEGRWGSSRRTCAHLSPREEEVNIGNPSTVAVALICLVRPHYGSRTSQASRSEFRSPFAST